MRARWLVSGILLGAGIGALAGAWAVRRGAVAYWAQSSYEEELTRVDEATRVLELLEANRIDDARARLESALSLSLELTDGSVAAGASAAGVLLGGSWIEGLGRAEAYARAHGLDPEVAERAARRRAELCASLSTGSKYRGLCEG